MEFKDIVGQQRIIERLEKSIMENKVGHAYIFAGPKGIGKKTIARAFSQMLLCAMPSLHSSCNECTSCKLFKENTNPDFYTIETHEDTIRIDTIRNLQNDIAIKPIYSKRKVYMIVDADKMNVYSQNCLLKVLEEPPEYGVIILTTSKYGALLSTIRSRGAKYNFSKYTQDEVREIIKEKNIKKTGNIDKKSLDFIVNYSDGVIGTALDLATSSNFVQLREKTIEIIDKFSIMKDIEYFNIYEFFDANKENIDLIFDIISSFFRDLIVIKAGGKENMLINSDKETKIKRETRNYTIEKLIKNIDLIESTRNNIKQNINYQLCIETMIIKLLED